MTAAQVGSVGRLFRTSIDDGGPLEDVQLVGAFAEVGDALHRCGARADDPDALAGESDEPSARSATGVVVVPPAGVERASLEVIDAFDPRQLGSVQRAVRHHHELRRHLVALAGRHNPTSLVIVPLHRRDLGLEAGVAVQVVALADRSAVGEDLRSVDILLAGYVVEFFEQREIHVRLDVAHCAWVTIPVPGAAEIAALFDHPDARDAMFAEPRPSEQAAEPATDDNHIGLVGQRRSLDQVVKIRVVDEVGELACDLGVLLIAVLTGALVALASVLLAQGIGVECQLVARHLSDRTDAVCPAPNRGPIGQTDRHGRRDH